MKLSYVINEGDGAFYGPKIDFHLSIERFIGILIEHFAGLFPIWLAPVQVKVLPISNNFMEYATFIMNELKAAGIRCEIDIRDEKLGYKIR